MTHHDQRLVIRGVIAFLAGVAALWILYSIRGALLVIYISGLLALGFTPMIRSLERQRLIGWRRLPRWAAILVVYFGLLALIGATIAIILPPLLGQTSQLWRDLPAHLVRAQSLLQQYRLVDHQLTVDEILGFLPGPGATFTAILGALEGVIGTLGTIVAILILPYYLLVEADTLQKAFLKMLPAQRRPAIARMTRDVTYKVGAWLNGQMVLGIIMGVSTSFALWLFDIPYFYVFGLVSAAGEFIPVVGPVLAAVPAVLLAATASIQQALIVIVFFGVQQFIEGNILVPRIMERQVGVSASTVVVALLIGSELLGVVGAILAVPSAAIVQVFLQEYLARDEE